ncbi:hypothetical protein MiAbW_00607 [Microcystis aeruginosa NIES-4325]|uniref:Uncharacterized protein n=1 Tax=Microcystis aeruginosa NIES-4325 TaxID=2569534 RepID=A0A5J4F475_MICAE|nr:hypothetical protein MiAbW_00607 [Microcystis aeruginosa NIES-4325]
MRHETEMYCVANDNSQDNTEAVLQKMALLDWL